MLYFVIGHVIYYWYSKCLDKLYSYVIRETIKKIKWYHSYHLNNDAIRLLDWIII
jgi:hypothetical protein